MTYLLQSEKNRALGSLPLSLLLTCRRLEFWEVVYAYLLVPRLFDLHLGGVEGLGGSLSYFSFSGSAAEVELENDGILIPSLSLELSISMLRSSSPLYVFLCSICTFKFPTLGA